MTLPISHNPITHDGNPHGWHSKVTSRSYLEQCQTALIFSQTKHNHRQLSTEKDKENNALIGYCSVNQEGGINSLNSDWLENSEPLSE